MDLELKKIKLLDEISICKQSLNDHSLSIDERIEIRKKLSLLLHKKEVVENRLSGKFSLPKNQVVFHRLNV